MCTKVPEGVKELPVPNTVAPLSWLIGTWRCENSGRGVYPTIQSFNYGEEITFANVGQPMLNYSAFSWHPELKVSNTIKYMS